MSNDKHEKPLRSEYVQDRNVGGQGRPNRLRWEASVTGRETNPVWSASRENSSSQLTESEHQNITENPVRKTLSQHITHHAIRIRLKSYE